MNANEKRIGQAKINKTFLHNVLEEILGAFETISERKELATGDEIKTGLRMSEDVFSKNKLYILPDVLKKIESMGAIKILKSPKKPAGNKYPDIESCIDLFLNDQLPRSSYLIFPTEKFEEVFLEYQQKKNRKNAPKKETIKPLKEGQIFIASHLKLQYKEKPFYKMYQGKVPSVACRLVQKHNGKFALDDIVNGANTRTEKKAEENLRDFQDNVKKKLGIKGDVSIISIVSEENGKMVIFNPDFWAWRQNS